MFIIWRLVGFFFYHHPLSMSAWCTMAPPFSCIHGHTTTFCACRMGSIWHYCRMLSFSWRSLRLITRDLQVLNLISAICNYFTCFLRLGPQIVQNAFIVQAIAKNSANSKHILRTRYVLVKSRSKPNMRPSSWCILDVANEQFKNRQRPGLDNNT